MDFVDEYFEKISEIYRHVGYNPSERAYPIMDNRKTNWRIGGDVLETWSKTESLKFADKILKINDRLQVYRGSSYTAVIVDTNVDDNIFMTILQNFSEVPNTERNFINRTCYVLEHNDNQCLIQVDNNDIIIPFSIIEEAINSWSVVDKSFNANISISDEGNTIIIPTGDQ
ncbi:MAG: hypothetical protein WC284_08755 [Candidimonas sp.]